MPVTIFVAGIFIFRRLVMIRKCQNINVFYLKLRRRNCQKGKKVETIISACISAAVTLVVCVISNNAQQEKTRTLMEYKLEELTKRVNEHNNLIKRTYALEEKMSVHEEQIKVANHRIEDLERKGE